MFVEIYNKKVAMIFVCIMIFTLCARSQAQDVNVQISAPTKSRSQPKAQLKSPTPSNQIPYTQSIQQFKSKKYNQRLQTLVGCWLLSKEYMDLYKSEYLFFKDLKLKEQVTLKLVKECMKKISRKNAILKITQLVGKNMQPAKKYEDVIEKSIIDDIFIQVNKQNIANHHQQPNTNEQAIINTAQTIINTTQAIINTTQAIINTTQALKEEGKLQINNQSNSSTSSNQSEVDSRSLSEFDIFLLDLIKNYESEFSKLKGSKEGIRGRVQQQLKKRQKYYFGFIPASSFTHSVLLVTISLSMVFCCTCYKYYKMRSNEKTLKKQQQTQQSEHSHAHSRIKQMKKMAKMSQMTMKNKTR